MPKQNIISFPSPHPADNILKHWLCFTSEVKSFPQVLGLFSIWISMVPLPPNLPFENPSNRTESFFFSICWQCLSPSLKIYCFPYHIQMFPSHFQDFLFSYLWPSTLSSLPFCNWASSLAKLTQREKIGNSASQCLRNLAVYYNRMLAYTVSVDLKWDLRFSCCLA